MKKAPGSEEDFENPQQYKDYVEWFKEIAANANRFHYRWPKEWKKGDYIEMFFDGIPPGEVVDRIQCEQF